jgi:hypothetical protein
VRLSGDESFDVRSLTSATSLVHLSAKPITVVPAGTVAYSCSSQLVAVCARFVCYTVKGSKVRALSRHSPVRTLLRAHAAPVTDLRFVAKAAAADDDDKLVSVAQDGSLGCWRLTLADPAPANTSSDDGVVATLLAHIVLDPLQRAPRGFSRIVCPSAAPLSAPSRILAVWSAEPDADGRHGGSRVALLDLDALGVANVGVEAVKMSDVAVLSPQSRVFAAGDGVVVNDVAVSTSGMVLALACSDSTVQLVAAHDCVVVSKIPIAGADDASGGDARPKGVTAVRFFAESLTLFVATHANTRFQLWDLTTAQCVARLSLAGGSIARELALMQLSDDDRTLVVASTTSARGYVVRLRVAGAAETPSAQNTGFTQIAEFALRQPILSMTLWAASADELQLYNVQSDGVQYLVVSPTSCFEPDSAVPLVAPIAVSASPIAVSTASIEKDDDDDEDAGDDDDDGNNNDDDDDNDNDDRKDDDEADTKKDSDARSGREDDRVPDAVQPGSNPLKLSAEEITQALREEEERKRAQANAEAEMQRRLEVQREALAKQQARHAALRSGTPTSSPQKAQPAVVPLSPAPVVASPARVVAAAPAPAPAAAAAAAAPAPAPTPAAPAPASVDDAELRAKEERKRRLREEEEVREKTRVEAMRALKERAASQRSASTAAAAPAPAPVAAAAAPTPTPTPVEPVEEPKVAQVITVEAEREDKIEVVEVPEPVVVRAAVPLRSTAPSANEANLSFEEKFDARMRALSEFMDSTSARLVEMEQSIARLTQLSRDNKSALGQIAPKVITSLKPAAPVAGGAAAAAAPMSADAATEAFKKQFTDVLVPGFEAACRKMLVDMSSAFDDGLKRRLEASTPQMTAVATAAAAAAAAALMSSAASTAAPAPAPAPAPKASEASELVKQNQAALAAQVALADELRKATALMQQTTTALGSAAQKLTATAAVHGASHFASQGASAASSDANLLVSAAASASAASSTANIDAQLAALAGSDGKYSGKEEQAFTLVLGLIGVKEQRDILQRLCLATNPDVVLSGDGPRLSQPVVLSLLQQLGATLNTGLDWKINWIKAAAMALDPNDTLLEQHLPGILKALLNQLEKQHRLAQTNNTPKKNDLKLLLHIVKSLLITKDK